MSHRRTGDDASRVAFVDCGGRVPCASSPEAAVASASISSAQTSGFDLIDAAISSMIEHGFLPSFPSEVEEEVEKLPVDLGERERVKDLRALLWSSIDNEDSKDLDQIEVAERI